ncbi:MAG: glycosyltransferase family 39 protein [Nitrospirae bacterium]|nr:glycosyltransferase family 39 protein [Nitrospirota bacterium]
MSLLDIDTYIFFFINRDLKNSVFDTLMRLLTDRYYLLILLLAVWLIIKDRKRALIPILLTVVSIALSDWLSNMLKHLIERIRPCHTLEGVSLLVGCGDSFSMPSNHAANASAIIFALSYRPPGDMDSWKRWICRLVAAIAVLVGFSRIYVGAHYPSDVIVGTSVGIAVSILVIQLYKWSAFRFKSMPYSTVFLVSLLFFGLFRIYYISRGILDISPDEAHYWEWSRRLDLSYYSKGPMIAYLIALGTAVFGDNVFGIRIMAVIFYTLSTILMYLLGKRLFDERTGMAAALLIQIVPLYSAYGVLFTIDSPFIFFWMLSLYLFWKAIQYTIHDTRYTIHDKKHASCIVHHASPAMHWILLGVSVGLGLLTKYTMVFFYACALLFFLVSKQHRGLLVTRWPYISLITSLIVFSPVIVWNTSYDWVTLKHTVGQAHISDQWSVVGSRSLKNFFEFLGSQIGIITPILFFMMFYAIFKLKSKDAEEYRSKFLFWFSIPVLLFFLLKSLHGKVQANWALPGYATGFLALSGLFASRWESLKKGIRSAIIIGVVLSLAATVIAHSLTFFNLPAKKDPSARLRGWKGLGVEVSRLSDEMAQKGPYFIFSDQYQVSSELAFYVKGHPMTYCINMGRRMNQYDLWPGFDNLIHSNAIFVTIGNVRTPEIFATGFDRCEKNIFNAYTGDRKLREYSIFTCYDFKGIQQGKITSY